MKLLLLPGLDGTGKLFEPFLRVLPSELSCRVHPLPLDGAQDPITLADRIGRSLALEDDVIIVAESFSGPIAYQLLQRHERKIKGLILVSSFLTSPRQALRVVRWLPLTWVPWYWSPRWLLRLLCLGGAASSDVVEEVREVIRSVPVAVIAERLRVLGTLEEPRHEIRVPCLYLQPDSDRLVPRKNGIMLQKWCSDFTLKQVSGPHFLLQAAPRECAVIVAEFVRALTEGA